MCDLCVMCLCMFICHRLTPGSYFMHGRDLVPVTEPEAFPHSHRILIQYNAVQCTK